MANIHRESTVSKLLGLLSVLFLVWSASSALGADWLTALWTVAGSTLAAYGGYRAAGGRHNPELAKATWEKQHRIDFVSDQVSSWPAKVEAMFSMLEQESGGNYAAALTGLKLRNVPLHPGCSVSITRCVESAEEGVSRESARQMICKPRKKLRDRSCNHALLLRKGIRSKKFRLLCA